MMRMEHMPWKLKQSLRDNRNSLLLLAILIIPVFTFGKPSVSIAGETVATRTATDKIPIPPDSSTKNLDAPLYKPFVELFILEELRNLRNKQLMLEAELIEKITDRELQVADKSMSYSSHTVTYFFYLIAGCTSLLVVLGWTSIRDVKDKFRSYADEQVSKLIVEYERRLSQMEIELQKKTQAIDENQGLIEQTNEIHSLWLRANQETQPQDKITVYDQILSIRPDDVETLTYKADAALQLDEPMWAISLCNKALEADPENAHGHYQKACAHAVNGNIDEALHELEIAILISDSFKDVAKREDCFKGIQESERFLELTSCTTQLEELES